MKNFGLLITFTLICFTLSPRTQAQALFPPTDGGYPENNTAEGDNALFSIKLSGKDMGRNNTAIGWGALEAITTGDENTASGIVALFKNTTGSTNTATGANALRNNTTGERNTAIGLSSLAKNTTGSFNVALGEGAGSGVITANDVICIGRCRRRECEWHLLHRKHPRRANTKPHSFTSCD